MKDLTVGKESKLIFQFAAPMLLGNFFQQLYNVVDAWVIGQFIDKQALAAVGASFPIIFILLSMVIGFASGATIIISQYYGAKKMDSVKRTIDTLYIVLFFASIVVTLLGILFSDDIFRLIQLPEDIFPQARLYLNIYFSGIVFAFGFNGTSAILRGLGDSKTPLYFMLISTLANIIMDLLFVIVFNWGIAGVAIATIIAQGGAFLTAIWYLNKTHIVVRLSISKLIFDRFVFRQSLRIGLPAGFQQTFVAIGLLALTWIVNLYGTDVIAAYSIAMRIDSLAFLPAMTFATALSTFVGQNMGANKPERVKAGLIATVIMSSVIAVLITIIAQLFPEGLIEIFTTDKEVIAIGANYLRIVSSFYIIFSVMFAYTGVMRGAGDTIVPMFITLIALWFVRIPAAYFLSQKMGVDGIWWSAPTGMSVGLVLAFLYYRSGRWKKKTVVNYDEKGAMRDD